MQMIFADCSSALSGSSGLNVFIRARLKGPVKLTQ